MEEYDLWDEWIEAQIEFDFGENIERARKTMKRLGLAGFNKPKETRGGGKSHVVMAKEGKKVKLIRFGQPGAKTVPGKPKTEKERKKKKSFKARHGENIKKGKMSAAYWSNKIKW